MQMDAKPGSSSGVYNTSFLFPDGSPAYTNEQPPPTYEHLNITQTQSHTENAPKSMRCCVWFKCSEYASTLYSVVIIPSWLYDIYMPERLYTLPGSSTSHR